MRDYSKHFENANENGETLAVPARPCDKKICSNHKKSPKGLLDPWEIELSFKRCRDQAARTAF